MMEGLPFAFALLLPSWAVATSWRGAGYRSRPRCGVATRPCGKNTVRGAAALSVALRASILNKEDGGVALQKKKELGDEAQVPHDVEQQKLATQKIAASLRGRILDMYVQFLSEDGSAVDYKALRNSLEFRDYQVVAQQLRDVQPQLLNRTERIAFFLNVYNALIIHGLAILDSPPSNLLQRLLFYAKNAYVIGGIEYSLNDIEHGVLRGNKPGPVPFSGKPFKSGDPRLWTSITESPDARIHFALNCGAKSCPPVRCFNADNLDYALEGAAQSFVTDEENVRLDQDRQGFVYLSSIFKWYRVDFCPENDTSDRALLSTIISYIDAESRDPDAKRLRAQLVELVESGQNVRCKFLPYNWSLNSA
ncbi:hypothetical protein FVE85_0489 [Porphyridium purpureum]|uniref:DUF547 domain-containing protein n=1 Tax=Porphyridium purpureum TaxID=35688 RepID=A0A5J4Z0G0_PORPP|nr:hypothetical protein FVE85_0489 [Porphyridium purpureum]|eukprot:POR9487..scf208_2